MSLLRNNSKKHIKREGQQDLFSALCVIIALIVILFIGSALLAIILSGLPCFTSVLKSEEIMAALKLSFATATVSSVIVVFLSLPTSYALTRTEFPLKNVITLILQLSMSLPFILLGFSLLIIFSSPFGQFLKAHGIRVIFAPLGIIMAHIIVNLPYAIRLIRTSFLDTDRRLEFIAETLGAGKWQCFKYVLLPLSRNSLISTFVLVWSRAMGEFGATLMVCGITRFKTETLPGSIYLSITVGDNDTAMATAMLMLLISSLTLIVAQVAERKDKDLKRQIYN